MRIESGPTRERIIRTALFLIIFGVPAGWFGYDGWKGYPQKNREEHLEQLTAEERAKAKDAPIYPNISQRLTDQDLEKAGRDMIKGGDVEARRAALMKIFGANPSYEGRDAWYYFGPAYRLRIPLKNGLPVGIEGANTDKSAVDILGQKGIAVVLAFVTVYFIVLMGRVLRTKLVLDDGGLVYRGKGPISWDAMQALLNADFARKGWVDLVYRGNGVEQMVRLDEYHLARFDAVIDELCQRKGFVNPLPVARSKQEPAA